MLALLNIPRIKALETHVIEEWSGYGTGDIEQDGTPLYTPLQHWTAEVYYRDDPDYDVIHGEWWAVASNGDTVRGRFGGIRYCNKGDTVKGTWEAVNTPPNVINYDLNGTFIGIWPKLSSSHQTDNVRNGKWYLNSPDPAHIYGEGNYYGTGQWISD